MSQQTFNFDVCSARHGGNAESVAAHKAIAPTLSDSREKVYEIIKAAGQYGATAEEVAIAIGKSLNAVSGRLSELKSQVRIRPSGLRRPNKSGCLAAVLVAV